jgi:hypothetical protein
MKALKWHSGTRRRPGQTLICMAVLMLLIDGCDSGPGPDHTPTRVSSKTPTVVLDRIDTGTQPDTGVSLVSSPDKITLIRVGDTQSFFLATSPSGSLEWRITSMPEWVTVEPAEGLIDHNVVEVKVKKNGVVSSGGITPGRIQIISSGGAAEVIVERTQDAPTAVSGRSTATPRPVIPATRTAQATNPLAKASKSSISFPPGANSADVSLTNAGTGELAWSVAPSDAWLKVSPSTGKLGPGESATLTVTKDDKQLTSGYASGFITIGSNSTGGDLKLLVDAAAAPMWLLDHRVIDAEYNAKSGLIVTISADPSKLNIVDPRTQKVLSVALPASPNCVSVQPDGAYAAVGHNAHVSYVNLVTGTLERTYDISADAIDVVLPGNGHVYAFPRTDQWETVRNVDLKTGGETLEAGLLYAGMLAKLHPSAKYIYGADNGLSPSDLHKFELQNGTIVNLGDSRYHGDYTIGGNLWFSEDGTRIFAKGGTVFRASEAASQDMLYAGQLEGIYGLRSAASSTAAKRVLALDGGSYNHPQVPGLRVYDTEFLAFKGTVHLPKFDAPGADGNMVEYDSQGHYVFINPASGSAYVLLNADPASGIEKDWALATYELSKLP